MKQNCWTFKKCGREPGGSWVKELGTCPVPTFRELDTANDGVNGGRSCWVIAGSLCGGKTQGSYAEKLQNCWKCDFMILVQQEEATSSHGFSATRLGMEHSIKKRKQSSASPAVIGQAART